MQLPNFVRLPTKSINGYKLAKMIGKKAENPFAGKQTSFHISVNTLSSHNEKIAAFP